MTPQQAALISQRAHRQIDADRCSCHTTAAELAALADAYLDAERRLAQIERLADAIWYDCGSCYRESEGRRAAQIKRLSKVTLDKPADP